MTAIKNDSDTSLCDFLHSIVPLNDEEREFLISRCSPVTIRKGGLIFKPGVWNPYIYFIKQGVIRSYIIEEGRQVTTWFNEEHEIIAPARTFGLKQPSMEHVQAMELTHLCRVLYEDVEQMYELFPVANKLGRLLLEENYRGAEERAYLARIMSAGKRYQRFLELQPSLLNRIPLKYIASYLNMSLETLSRIRGKRMF